MKETLSSEVARQLKGNPVLQTMLSSGTVSLSGIMDMISMNEEKKLKEIDGLDLTKIKERDNGNRVYIHLGRKLAPLAGAEQFLASDRSELIHKLYMAFFGKSARITLNEAFDRYEVWRLDVGTYSKTMREDVFEWNRFFKNSSIGNMFVDEIRVSDVRDVFLKMTAGNAITRTRFVSARCVLNGVMRFCTEQEYVTDNVVEKVNIKNFAKRFKPTHEEHDNYSREEIASLVRYLRLKAGDVYDDAARFALLSCVRIGEIKTLRYEDIGDGVFSINSSGSHTPTATLDENGKVTFGTPVFENHEVKGAASAGFRTLPLTKEAAEIAEAMKSAYPDNPYLFMSQGKPLSTVTFNRHLRRACEALGIKYRPSHGIRFSNCDALHDQACVDDRDMQRLMGHTSLRMTEHYFNRHSATADGMERARNYLEIG